MSGSHVSMFLVYGDNAVLVNMSVSLLTAF